MIIALMAIVAIAAVGIFVAVSDDDSPKHGGATVEEIRASQTVLNELGCYPYTVDGAYGPHRQQAVEDFQEAMGLSVDGVLSAETRSEIDAAGTAGSTVCTGG